MFIPLPPQSQYFQTNVPFSFNGENFEVEIEAGIQLDTGQVFADFVSIDPFTSLPPSVDVGFLPPEDGTGRGKGHISYLVRPKPNLPVGTQITNVAFIQFDVNPVIATDQADPHDASKGIDTNKLALITIDDVPPQSAAMNLPLIVTNSSFLVCWSGTDVGSGIVAYDIYSSTNRGIWGVWLSGTTNTCATFPGSQFTTYGFFSVAHDGAGNVEPQHSFADAATLVLPHYPPTIDQMSNRFAVVGQDLIVTNTAQGSYPPFLFSLDSSAPAAASITPSGIFDWTPSCSQGSTMNQIRIWATDSGAPPVSNSMTFLVTVSDCLQVGVGSTVLQVGQNGCIPVNLLASVGLTNLTFNLAYPSNRFANWTIGATNPAVGAATVQPIDPERTRFILQARSGQAFQGPGEIAQLCFTAQTNPSAFVLVSATSIVGAKQDGTLMGNVSGQPGRVVDIGREPLLEAWRGTNLQRMLTLYGNPGATYALGYRTNILGTNWLFAWHTPMTNLSEIFPAATTAPQLFYRAWEFSADPPILELSSASTTNLMLLLYGAAGTNYVLQATTNLSSGSGWFPAASFTLSNSFQFINEPVVSKQNQFFRAKRP